MNTVINKILIYKQKIKFKLNPNNLKWFVFETVYYSLYF
jgi:hypothetical protein